MLITINYLLILSTSRPLVSTVLAYTCTVVVHQCVQLHVPLFSHSSALEHLLYTLLETTPDLVEVTWRFRGRSWGLRTGWRHFVKVNIGEGLDNIITEIKHYQIKINNNYKSQLFIWAISLKRDKILSRMYF